MDLPRKSLSSNHIRVIVASSLGTIFEWYDFNLYATLASNIAEHFFSNLPPGPAFVMALFTFASGLAIRPFGALLFGYFGDKMGRKYSFLATILIMGLATFLVGLLPTYETIGIAAPITLIVLRCIQGLAVGGEYGGAATYLAEHSPPEKRGLYTGFLQSATSLGFLSCILVVIACQAWGWRVPFLISGILLVISVYIRTKLHESPIFKEIKSTGQNSKKPIKESFFKWTNLRIVLMVLFGAVTGQAAVSYSSHIYAFYFIDTLTGNCLLAIVYISCCIFTLFFGWISDRIGRKPMVMLAFLIFLPTCFPLYRSLTHYGNPDLELAMRQSPAVVIADPKECSYQVVPSELKKHIRFTSSCDLLRNLLNQYSVSYTSLDGPPGSMAMVKIGNVTVASLNLPNLNETETKLAQKQFARSVRDAIINAGYPTKADHSKINFPMLILAWACLTTLKAMTYGSLAAWLVELFPTKIRYTCLSFPYHLGNGWVGGFLPTIAFSIVLMTGNIYAGLWYPIITVSLSLVIGLLLLNETKDVDLSNEEEITQQTLPIIRFCGRAKQLVQKIFV